MSQVIAKVLDIYIYRESQSTYISIAKVLGKLLKMTLFVDRLKSANYSLISHL